MDDFDILACNELRKKRQFSRKWIIFTAYKKSLSEWVLEDTNNIGLYNISFYQTGLPSCFRKLSFFIDHENNWKTKINNMLCKRIGLNKTLHNSADKTRSIVIVSRHI